MTPIGGSEILWNNLIKYTGVDWMSKINLISSLTDPINLDPNRRNVVWQHLYIDQGGVQGMRYREFTDYVQNYVYVSNWQLDEFKKEFGVDVYNNIVIKNAIDPIEFLEKPKDKIRLIYTSMPDRGLEILLEAWKILNRKDIELIVYSSNIIYGKAYSDFRRGMYDKLFTACKTTSNIHYKGFGINQAVRKALQTSHILAYPSIYPETSCLAAIEAGAAGCKIVTTDYGALPETCNNWATHVPYSTNVKELAEHYAYELNSAIDNYWENSNNIKEQSDWFNTYYSWHNRAIEWKDFFKKLCEK
jgi:UDP-glucose:(glucosyl)LPS alpha-1,2-glucosyltransferase